MSFAQINKLFKDFPVPTSPQTAAFMRYGQENKNLYTGTNSIQIPLYTYPGREMSFPMSLTYDASGIKVEQVASQVGLGWNLAVGGRISRITNGLPDHVLSDVCSYLSFHNQIVKDKLETYYDNFPNNAFDTQQEAIDYFDFLRDIDLGNVEVQPDYYSLNALGINDYIVFDSQTLQAKTLKNPRIKVHVDIGNTITRWVITNEDGTKYHFEERELTTIEGTDVGQSNPCGQGTPIRKEFVSAWLLTKIESPNLKDVYTLEYVDFGYNGELFSAVDQYSISNLGDYLLPQSARDDIYPIGYGNVNMFSPKTEVKELFLSSVKLHGQEIIKINLTNRLDLSNQASRIDYIEVKDFLNSNKVFRKFNFQHTYFGNPNNNQNPDPYEVRLKLDGVAIGTATEVIENYSFDYYSPDQIPSRLSLGQDYMGYYNGKNINLPYRVLYPTVTIGNDTYLGADRDPDFNKAIVGNLKQITYPTGGYTIYTYEPNEISEVLNGETYTVENHTYGQIYFTGGSGNLNDCNQNFYCTDKFPNGYLSQSQVFYISDEDKVSPIQYYNLQVNLQGTYEGVLFKFLNATSQPTPKKFNDIWGGAGNSFLLIGEQEDIYWVTGYPNNYDENILLTEGWYQLYVASDGGLCQMNITGPKLNVAVSTIYEQKAGMRIKHIAHYDETGSLAQAKTFRYTKEIDSDETSEVQLYEPTLFESKKIRGRFQTSNNCGLDGIPNTNCEAELDVDVYTRYSYSPNANEPHMAYSRVYEMEGIVADGQAPPKGYIEHNFEVRRTGLQKAAVHPYHTQYFTSLAKAGKEISNTAYNNSNEKVQSNSFIYGASSHNTSKGVYLTEDYLHTYYYPLIYKDVDGKFRHYKVLAVFSCLISQELTGGNCNGGYVQPNVCNEYTNGTKNHCMGSIDVAKLVPQTTYALGSEVNMVTSNSTSYGFSDPNSITQTTTNTFGGAEDDYQLLETSAIDSRGDNYITSYNYPRSRSGIAAYDQLVQENKLSIPVQITHSWLRNGQGNRQTLQTEEYTFDIFDGRALLSSTEMSYGINPLETEFETHKYVALNPVEYSKAQDVHTSYLWGYKNTLPVVQGLDISYEALLSASNAALSSIGQSDLESLLISLGDMNTDAQKSLWMSYNTALRNQSSLQDRQIFTYTHNRLKGLTSQTDPNGITQYYEYDDFGRLRLTRDQDGNILQMQEYNYKNN